MEIDVRGVGPAPLLATLGIQLGIFLAEKLGLKFSSRLPATYDLAYELTLKTFGDDN